MTKGIGGRLPTGRRSPRTKFANPVAIHLLLIDQYPLRRPVEILVLAAAQRPEEGDQGGAAECQRGRDEVGQDRHGSVASATGAPAGAGADLAPPEPDSRSA